MRAKYGLARVVTALKGGDNVSYADWEDSLRNPVSH